MSAIPEYDEPIRPVFNEVYDAPSGSWKFIVNPTPEQQFGISAQDAAALRELREALQRQYSLPGESRFYTARKEAERWLRAFDALTQGRFK